jgi:YtkA-like
VRRAPRPGGAGRLHTASAGARRAVAAGLCVAAIVCAGCAASPTPRVVGEGSGGVTARLALSPDPAPVMKPLQLSVTLADAGGQPIVDRAVSFDLSMPAMTMPPNRPPVTAAGDGVYEATTLLSMAGEWRLTVEIGGSDPPQTILLTFSAQ